VGAGLLASLGRSTTLVVGKGGVGKTTTAGGLALALADSGVEAHLLSSDPAHSLGDLFQQPLPPRPTPSRCTPRLVLEEMDAAALARARLTPLEPALRELVERGTYLDASDAEALVGAALPGLDEVGAALRIGELAAAGKRLVVDTAPTGHTLRLLDTEATVRSWIAVFQAMADKAGTVASALLGTPVRLAAEAALERLAAELAGFTTALRAADVVVVTGPGAALAAETDRLLGELRRRSLHVAATVAMARPGAAASVLLPVRPGLAGCGALRVWWTGAAIGGGAVPGQLAEPPMITGGRPRPCPPRALPAPLDRELVVFAGKGGVGKTTCAAALAVRLAEQGPVTLLGADPAGSLGDVLGAQVPSLRVLEVDAEAELERLRDRYRQEVEQLFAVAGLHRAATLDRRIVESLWGVAPPGVDELVALARLADAAPETARLVLDTAPTGHFLRLAALPGLALDWTHRLMRVLLRYRSAGLDGPAGPLLRLAGRLRALSERLSDPARTSIVIVAIDEPLILAESGRLVDRLREMDLPTGAIVLNHAAGPVIPEALARAGTPVFRAPTVPVATGPAALRSFFDRWQLA
jgi:arsenite/tail-anchored protein-transporting ATPase